MSVVKKQLDFDILTSTMNQIISKVDFNIKNINYQIQNSLHTLQVYIWKREVGKIETFKKTHIPKTWKDHFKYKYRARRWMRWWIKRKPVKYFTIKRVTIFPEVKIPANAEFKNSLTYMEIVENGHTES